MAGIGFRIGHLLRSDDLSSKIGGVIASVVLSSGPWLCTILSIAGISALTPLEQDPLERQLFRIIINYTYVASLIGFSLIEMTSTRYIADAIYLRQERVIPTLFTFLSTAVLGVAALAGIVFYSLTELEWRIILICSTLLSIVTVIWCSMIFLSACKDYLHITLCFLAGTIVSVLTVILATRLLHWGLLGQLVGFTAGQVTIFILLATRIFREFGTGFLFPRDYLSHTFKNRSLILVGLLYALAIWIDKFCFWSASDTSEKVASYFFKSSAYDAGLFLSYLFVVPAMAYFLVKVETEFYVRYRRYFSLIDQRAPLSLIDDARVELVRIIRNNMSGLCLFQGFFTLPALILGPEIVEAAGLPVLYVTVFRYGLFGASLHVFMLFTNILILYFDLPRAVLRNYALFFFMNGICAFFTARWDYRFHGVGYAVAALVSLVVSLVSLRTILRDLNFYIFMKQPLGKPTSVPLVLDKIKLA